MVGPWNCTLLYYIGCETQYINDISGEMFGFVVYYGGVLSSSVTWSEKQIVFSPTVPNPRFINNRREYPLETLGKCAYSCTQGMVNNTCDGFFVKDNPTTICIELFENPVELPGNV